MVHWVWTFFTDYVLRTWCGCEERGDLGRCLLSQGCRPNDDAGSVDNDDYNKDENDYDDNNDKDDDLGCCLLSQGCRYSQ